MPTFLGTPFSNPSIYGMADSVPALPWHGTRQAYKTRVGNRYAIAPMARVLQGGRGGPTYPRNTKAKRPPTL